MSLVYFFMKLYPVIGISLGVLSYDLMRLFRRRGNSAWVGMALFLGFFILTTLLWFVFRGDKNADLWFGRLNDWLHHKVD